MGSQIPLDTSVDAVKGIYVPIPWQAFMTFEVQVTPYDEVDLTSR